MSFQTEELRILLRTVADARGADQVRNSLRQVATAQTSTTSGFRTGAASALQFAGALTGVQVGVGLAASALGQLQSALVESVNVTRDHERVMRATAAAYGSTATQFQRFAAQLEAQTGFTSDAILEAALSARTLSTNYGLTITQTQKLISVSADLARIRGIGVAEAFERVQSAIRGEAEASEFLGLTLNATFLKNNAMNGSLKNTFETMSDAQKAQVVYGELLKQTAAFSGLASNSTNSLDTAFNKAAVSGRKLQLTIGEIIKPATLAGLRGASDAFGLIAEALTVASKLSPGILFTGGAPAAIGAGMVVQRRDEARAAQEAIKAEHELQRLRQINENTPPPPDPVGAFQRDLADRRRADQQNRRLQEVNELPSRDFAAETQRLAFLDQRDAATRDLILAQQELNTLQRQAIQLSAQEAEIRLRQLPAERALAELQRQQTERQVRAKLAALPANEALEDTQNAIARARLVVADRRGQSSEDRSAARREIRGLTRNVVPGQELAAFDANQGVRSADRGGTRLDLQTQLQQIANARALDSVTLQQETNQLLLSINSAAQQTAQQRLDETIARAIKEGIASVKELPMRVTVNVTAPDGSVQTFDELIEAAGQAETPPVIQLSGVRR